MIFNNKPIIPIGKPMSPTKPEKNRNIDKGADFDFVFQQELARQSGVKFSRHAIERLQVRNISLTKDDLGKISEAVNKAAEKGVKETLIIMGNSAFIANVKNKMIITAATEENLKNNVFTNIDGAVII
ncbi:MAG TPA: TIGR02530 family flagellar biosynthesis protein [Bacillota bacterium]|nr:TIGR02530 family flagellar biosynthesis protein [Bacillota bacterium]HOR85320.1 TIGR02530 family flagellar biosynthesis protein [Bacillota bacterium]HPL53741.1 TIGR02530 family flagellar biosynthesis protein [Bacillota bacterium]